MDIVVALDFRFCTTADGRVWTSTNYSHDFWTRYLEVFDRVRIVARSAPVSQPVPQLRRVDGEGVSLAPVPFYLGPAQYLLKARAVRRAALRAIGEGDAVILRVGSELGTCIASSLWPANRPYGLEVVGDPYEAFRPGAIHHPLRPFLRWRNTRMLKQQCARACGAAYVTGAALQRRYACPQYEAAVSDVDLSAFLEDQPSRQFGPGERSLIFVGSLEQMYKAPDVLLDAFALCLRADPSLSLTMVGEGRHMPELQRRALSLGIEGRVRFLGRLNSGAEVREALDRSSLLVLPSRTEGLPRAILEAMARGLPCIGTAVGGIPELLEEEDLVPPDNAARLAGKILEVTADPERMRRTSARNFVKASQFREELLKPRRLAFYRHVAGVTASWAGRRGLRTPEAA